ncbi:MFS transporter [Uliginosibacterium sp. H3]|uniref:MFS transporter n=1 Tax=Uliginosibacterium silvisoli TaxID=3114758 RepID=A0ABU6K046_9RHOO|nr:MFS transporter [Uliginosibacterium sp. H3]
MSAVDTHTGVRAVAGGTHRTAVLAIVLVSYLMIVLDISIVITALPKIQRSLDFSATELSWVQNAYTLAFGGLLLLGARAGDILGRRRMFVVGMSLFTVTSLAIGLAQSPAWLLLARAIQGIGAATLAPSTLALLSTNFPEGPQRTRALSLYGATAGVGASIGLVLGGVIADWLSWRVGFFINLPIGIAVIFGALRYINETRRRPGQFDLAGALSSTLGMTALVFGLVRSAATGWSDALTQASLAAGVLLMAFLVWNEARVAQPIMPLRLFANRERAGAYAARVLFLGAMVGFWFFTTQFLQHVLGFTPFEAGLAYLPTTLPNFASALMVPRLTRRFGNGPVLAGGLALTLLGMIWLAFVTVDASYLTGIALPMILLGVGQGCTLSPLTISGVAGVAAEDAGAASGLVNAAHQLGGSLGLAILVVVFASVGTGEEQGGRAAGATDRRILRRRCCDAGVCAPHRLLLHRARATAAARARLMFAPRPSA